MTPGWPQAPPGWYTDPAVPGQLRYFDGQNWTEHVSVAAPTPTPPAVHDPPTVQQPADPTLVAERRNVYGNDILYVTAEDGTKVGHINLATAKVTIDQPELRSQFDQTVETWQKTHTASPTPEHVATIEPVHPPQATYHPTLAPEAPKIQAVETPTTETAWQDLSANRAGQAAREKAIQVRKQAPVKAFVGRVLRVNTDERAWRVGADGEELVGARLAKLDDQWHVIHAVPVGQNDSDIDHIVIGPPGVFTLNTKNHSRHKLWIAEHTFMVNGQKVPYLRNSHHEAERAAKLLSAACGFPVAVEPIIVVIAGEMTIKAQPPDVHIVARKQIAKWLSKRPPMLTSDRIEEIFHQARRDTTWRTTHKPSP